MLAFIIPVKSKTVSSDWASFSQLADRCINSICNQLDSNFIVVLACHEIPETKFNKDPRVEFLQVDFPPPIMKGEKSDYWEKEADKGKKLKLAAGYAERKGATYVMTVDADDCISNKICSFVSKNASNSIPGWYVKKGYLYEEGKKYAYLNLKNFNTICGSGVIIKPKLIELMYGENFYFHHEKIQLNNNLLLLPLPFAGTIYSMLNGSNIVLNRQGMHDKRTKLNPLKANVMKTLFRRLGKYRIVLLVSLKKEFAITTIK